MRRSKDFFQAIAEYEHSNGIYLTYTLDDQVIDKLSEYASGTKLILHDYRQGVPLDDNVQNSIVCLPVKTHIAHQQNCFHSKLALLKGESGAKLIVGSTNLHRNSFRNEINVALELDLNFLYNGKVNTGNVYIYNRVVNYLENVVQNNTILGRNFLKETLKKIDLKSEPSGTEFIFSSEHSSIFAELQKYLQSNKTNQKATSIRILTPYISRDYSDDTIAQLKNISSDISVFLPTSAGSKIFRDRGFSVCRPKNNKSFHSKIFLIEYVKDVVVYIGSANFSQQGFFKSLLQAGNQECGIVFTGSKDFIETFFAKDNWREITEAEETENEEILETLIEPEPYAWAEKNPQQIINTYIFNPLKSEITDLKNKKIEVEVFDDPALSLYKTDKLKPLSDNKISFCIGKNKISISLYDLIEYKQSINDKKGESIFYLFKKENSIVPREMDEAIDERHLTASEGKFYVIEPPKLEQYWRNVKDFIKSLENKKVFWDSQLRQIEDVLSGKINIQGKQLEQMDEGHTGRYLYLALHLLRLAKGKKQESLKYICEKRIEELTDMPGFSIDKNKLNSFLKNSLKKW